MAETKLLDRTTGGSRPYNNLLRVLREPDYALIAPHLFAAETAPTIALQPMTRSTWCLFCGPAMVSRDRRRGRHDVETVLAGASGRRHREPRAAAGLHRGQVRRKFARLAVALEAAKARSPAPQIFVR